MEGGFICWSRLFKTKEVNDYLEKLKELQEKAVDTNKLMNVLKIHRGNRAFYSHKIDFTKTGEDLSQKEFFEKEMPYIYYFAMPDINDGTKLVPNKNIVFDKPGLTRHVYVQGKNIHGANVDIEIALEKARVHEGNDKNIVKIGNQRFQGLRMGGETHDIPFRSFHSKEVKRRYEKEDSIAKLILQLRKDGRAGEGVEELGGLVDWEKEISKLNAQIISLQNEIKGLKNELNKEQFWWNKWLADTPHSISEEVYLRHANHIYNTMQKANVMNLGNLFTSKYVGIHSTEEWKVNVRKAKEDLVRVMRELKEEYGS